MFQLTLITITSSIIFLLLKGKWEFWESGKDESHLNLTLKESNVSNSFRQDRSCVSLQKMGKKRKKNDLDYKRFKIIFNINANICRCRC